MIKRKIKTKGIDLQEISSKLYFGDEEIAIFESSKGFGILTLLHDIDTFVFLTDEGVFPIRDNDLDNRLTHWNFVEYKRFKDLEISF